MWLSGVNCGERLHGDPNVFKPMHSLLTIVLDPDSDITTGGIVLPKTFQASVRTGVVRAVGPDAYHKTEADAYVYPVRAGDRVVLGAQKNQRGQIVNFATVTDEDGVEVALVNFTDVWGVLDGTKEPLIAGMRLAECEAIRGDGH
jgi:co-chaperonin GroES (HSP10)